MIFTTTGAAGHTVASPLGVMHPCLLTATGDAARVEVWRSPLVKLDSRLFTPVREHLATHGLTLVFTEAEDDTEWMHGERIREIYA